MFIIHYFQKESKITIAVNQLIPFAPKQSLKGWLSPLFGHEWPAKRKRYTIPKQLIYKKEIFRLFGSKSTGVIWVIS